MRGLGIFSDVMCRNVENSESGGLKVVISCRCRFIELSEQCHKLINRDAIGWWKDEVRV